jgi:hypothetical protein
MTAPSRITTRRSAVQGSLPTDVGGNLLYKYATAKHAFLLRLALSALLAGMAAYGFFCRRADGTE